MKVISFEFSTDSVLALSVLEINEKISLRKFQGAGADTSVVWSSISVVSQFIQTFTSGETTTSVYSSSLPQTTPLSRWSAENESTISHRQFLKHYNLTSFTTKHRTDVNFQRKRFWDPNWQCLMDTNHADLIQQRGLYSFGATFLKNCHRRKFSGTDMYHSQAIVVISEIQTKISKLSTLVGVTRTVFKDETKFALETITVSYSLTLKVWANAALMLKAFSPFELLGVAEQEP